MEMAALRSISADVSHEAAIPGPRRSPPALLYGSPGVTPRPSGALEGRACAHTTPDSAWLYHLAAAESIQYGPRTTHQRTQDGFGRSLRPRGSLGVTGVAWGTPVHLRERARGLINGIRAVLRDLTSELPEGRLVFPSFFFKAR